MEGKFSPGAGRATAGHVHRGITPVSDMSSTEGRRLDQVDDDAAWARTSNTAAYADERERDRKEAKTTGPTGYHACLKMVTSFSARLCVLFTENCSLY